MKYRASLILAVMCLYSTACLDKEEFDPVSMDLPSDTIDVTAPPGSVELSVPSHGEQMGAVLYTANGAGPHPSIALLHGFPGNEKNIDLAQALRRADFNVLVFYYRGAWGSGGTYSVAGLLDDVRVAIDFLRESGQTGDYRIDPDRISLVGHSLGGFAALRVGTERDDVLCTVGAAPADVVTSGERRTNFDFSSPAATAPVNGLGGYTLADLVREVSANQEAFALLPRMVGFERRALLIVSADADKAVPLDDQRSLAKAARDASARPFEHVILGADHGFSANRIEFMRVVVGWMSEHCR
jgi:pimeloyl-ACP methyl ester carboxylesterase